MSICPKTLKSFAYYKNKLPLYLQNSQGFQEHFKIWYDMMVGYSYDGKTEIENDFTGVIQVGDTVLTLLDIFDGEFNNLIYSNRFLDKLILLENAWPEDATDEFKAQHPYGTNSDILDKLGSIYGVSRNFSIQYDYNAQTFNETIQLDNQSFLLYIMIQIIKNYCDGSYEQLQEYYSMIGLNLYITTSSQIATSSLYLVDMGSSINLTDIQKLFLAGQLRVESMGVKYEEATINISNILIWDNESTQGWDDATWL